MSDYERYLRTDELLALQKPDGERVHHDELLFQVVHQSSELWLRLVASETEASAARIRDGELAGAAIGRAVVEPGLQPGPRAEIEPELGRAFGALVDIGVEDAIEQCIELCVAIGLLGPQGRGNRSGGNRGAGGGDEGAAVHRAVPPEAWKAAA